MSFIDVVKGIEMFDELQVPTISVVENMVNNFINFKYLFNKFNLNINIYWYLYFIFFLLYVQNNKNTYIFS